MARYEVGARVRINQLSEYHNKGDYNPKYTVHGTVTKNDRCAGKDYDGEHHQYQVEWDNGISNCYRHKDLVPVGG
jgi:hypothetical protein